MKTATTTDQHTAIIPVDPATVAALDIELASLVERQTASRRTFGRKGPSRRTFGARPVPSELREVHAVPPHVRETHPLPPHVRRPPSVPPHVRSVVRLSVALRGVGLRRPPDHLLEPYEGAVR